MLSKPQYATYGQFKDRIPFYWRWNELVYYAIHPNTVAAYTSLMFVSTISIAYAVSVDYFLLSAVIFNIIYVLYICSMGLLFLFPAMAGNKYYRMNLQNWSQLSGQTQKSLRPLAKQVNRHSSDKQQHKFGAIVSDYLDIEYAPEQESDLFKIAEQDIERRRMVNQIMKEQGWKQN